MASWSQAQGTDTDPRYAWWEAEPDGDEDDGAGAEYIQQCRASSLISCARRLESAQREVHEQNLWAASLYSNRELAAFDWGTGQLYRASLAPISRTGENIVVRVVDTLVSQICKNKPKPKPTARGASYRTRSNIQKLDKFLFGSFSQNDAYRVGKMAVRDAFVFGFGCIKVTAEKSDDPAVEGDKICYERVFPDEILVDQMEIVACGKMRHLYRRRALPIEVIASTYGLDEDEVEELATQQDAFTYLDYRPVGKGWAVVVEGYQVAVGKNKGRWMVALNNRVLDEGEWAEEWLPFVFYHAQMPISGFYAPSIVEQAIPYQIRLNEINEVIRDAQDVMARPRIFVAEGSRVNPLELDNVIGRVVKFTGQMPQAMTWPAVSSELYNERDRLVRVCLEHFGLSNLATSVTPPPGARFDSSPAFREFSAIQDDRLSDMSERQQRMYEELAQRTIQVIEREGVNPRTTWYSGWRRGLAQTIDWKDMAHDASSYVMTMESVSIFSMSPAAYRDELEKQLAMGLITPEQYRMEIADPDEESALSLQAAAAEDLNRVQEMLEDVDAEFEPPIPEQDLVNGVSRITLAMLALSKYDDVPDEVVMRYLNWLTFAKAILAKGQEPMSTQAPDMPGAAPAGLAGPSAVPVPEAAGIAPAGPRPMPNISAST